MVAFPFFKARFRKTEPPSRRLKILVADDNPDAVSALTELLVTEGYEARGVSNSLELLSAVVEHNPDVVILDLHMPNIGGYDLARWLRSRHKAACPLLIAISGQYTRPADEDLARATGFDHYFVKPFDLRDLASAIGRVARR